MADAMHKAQNLAGYVEVWLEANGKEQCTMTDATEAIWGTSGRGNPNAVRLIEACETLGFLRIQKVGKVKRLVGRTDKPIPLFSDEDRAYQLRLLREG